MKSENAREKKLIVVICVMLLFIIVLLGLLVVFLVGNRESAGKSGGRSEEMPLATVTSTATPIPTMTPAPTETPTPTVSPAPTVTQAVVPTAEPTETPIPKVKYPGMDMYLANRLMEEKQEEKLEELLGTSYDGIWPVTSESMSCLAVKDGKWGLVSATGDVLVPLKYERFSFRDNTGWVEFEQNGYFYVYDESGKLIRLYADKTDYRMQSEDGHLFRTAKAYMSGMEITFTIPEIQGEDYYGVEYRSKETGEVLYQAVGGYQEVGLFTYPDETGRAVAIHGDGIENTIYSITAEGCESRIMELPINVKYRKFYFVGNYTWADYSLSNGWVKVFVSDSVRVLFEEMERKYFAFLNVDTMELIPFPEKYQTYFAMQNRGYADAISIRVTKEEETKNAYAVCKGNRVLTEEQYQQINFREEYILAFHEEGVDILDYNGNKMGSYLSSNGSFINGRMLVLDEEGLYFVDESFKRCSDYILPDFDVDGCFARGVIMNGKYYLLPEIAMEELPKSVGEATPQPTVTPVPSEIPVKLAEAEYEAVEFMYDVYRHLGDAYIIRNGKYYGMADLQGNILVEPGYEKWVYDDRDWVSFEDSSLIAHVFDHAGNELYTYNYNLGEMATENGQPFYRFVFYRQGMRIEFDYNDADDYYGIHYYNAETKELIFELTDEMCLREENAMPDFQIASMPDSTGTAVVIGGSGFANTMYLITKDGYTEEEYIEPFLERRNFFFSDHKVWNDTNLYNGWLLTKICEERGELLDYSMEWKNILYNIHTKERIPLPEDYQDWRGEFYQHSAGLYYGISGESSYDQSNGETEFLYYAICRGNEALTPELYQWITFDEKYIIAGNNSFSHILDYDGTVLAEYQDVAYPFVDGKTLVCDDIGAFYIDENLCRCSEYIMEQVDYCHPNYIRKEDKFYLILLKDTEE